MATTQVNIELRFVSGTTTYPVTNAIIKNAIITERLSDFSKIDLHLKTFDINFVDTYLRNLTAAANPKLQYRVVSGSPGNQSYSPWGTFLVTNYRAVLDGVASTASHLVKLVAYDSLLMASRFKKTVARQGLISDIVQQICGENNFNKTVIEPTVGNGIYIQSYSDDSNFLRMRMVQRALNQQQHGNFHCYFQDDTFHFHSPSYQAALKNLNIFEIGISDKVEADLTQTLIPDGISGVRVVSSDPSTGNLAETVTDFSNMLKFGNSMNLLQNLSGAQKIINYHVSDNRTGELTAIAQSIAEAARTAGLRFELGVSQIPFIRPGNILNLIVSTGPGKSSPWAGLYLVIGAIHHIENGSATSLLTLSRGEFQIAGTSQQNMPQNSNTAVTTNSATAPGDLINVNTLMPSP